MLVGFVVLIIVAGIMLDHWSVNEYGITPGDATPVGQFIEVPAHLNHPISGNILLTDVYVTQLNALTYLQERYLSSDAEVISSDELLGPSTPANEYLAQGYLEMMQAQQAATAAALSHLGLFDSMRSQSVPCSTASIPVRPPPAPSRWRRSSSGSTTP